MHNRLHADAEPQRPDSMYAGGVVPIFVISFDYFEIMGIIIMSEEARADRVLACVEQFDTNH